MSMNVLLSLEVSVICLLVVPNLGIPELQKSDIVIVNPIWPSTIYYLFWNKYIAIHIFFPYSTPVFFHLLMSKTQQEMHIKPT